ncbi:MAG: presenilin family intramembrane aspartyl protease [archaeon]
MKHNAKVTLILVAMFIVTQLIGLAVIHAYTPVITEIVNQTTGEKQNVSIGPVLPYNLEPPETEPEISLISIVIGMTIAVLLILVLMKIKAVTFLRLWFFLVIAIAIGVSFNASLQNYFQFSAIIALVISLPLAFFKVFKRNIIVHNFTELLIYPGIAAIFVPILTLWSIILLLILISAYDIYAVWHAGFMQKMAHFQMNELKFFAGFFVPYIDKKTRQKLKQAKKSKSKKEQKVKVNLAILGGGDVVFPIIAAGVFLRAFGIVQALSITLFATLALLALFMFAKKGKFYPAMPFLTAGIFVGMLIAYITVILGIL